MAPDNNKTQTIYDDLFMSSQNLRKKGQEAMKRKFENYCP